MRTSERCKNGYQGSNQNWNQLLQTFGMHDQGPIYLHSLKSHSSTQQQTCKEDLHGSSFPVENKPKKGEKI